MKSTFCLLLPMLLLSISNIQAQNKPNLKSEFEVPFEEYSLNNGLHVILHIDKSDPVVAVALTSHVGSAREIP